MRTVLTLILAGALACVGIYALGAVLFVLRSDDPLPRTADAVVVLAGSATRLPVGLDLVREGRSKVLVVTRDDGRQDPARTRLCNHGAITGVEIICTNPVPHSTRGEARLVARLARKRGWRTLVVISSRYHLFRAQRLFERCTDAQLVMRGAPESVSTNLGAIPFEWAKLGLAETVRRGC